MKLRRKKKKNQMVSVHRNRSRTLGDSKGVESKGIARLPLSFCDFYRGEVIGLITLWLWIGSMPRTSGLLSTRQGIFFDSTLIPRQLLTTPVRHVRLITLWLLHLPLKCIIHGRFPMSFRLIKETTECTILITASWIPGALWIFMALKCCHGYRI